MAKSAGQIGVFAQHVDESLEIGLHFRDFPFLGGVFKQRFGVSPGEYRKRYS